MQVLALCINAHTIYFFPTALSCNLSPFLKSRNLKWSRMSPKIHFTDTINWLVALFQEFWRGVLAAPWKRPITCGQRGFAGSPYKQRMLLLHPWAYCWRSRNKHESPSIPLSWRQPFTGLYKSAIKPFRATTDWNLNAWSFLWQLYSMR